MLDVRRLRLLRELAHRGTIAAVAEALQYTPSAVSQQLSTLEREVGRSLLTRTGRGVTLTPEGVRLVEHAEVILADIERAEADLQSHDDAVAGLVRLASFPSALRPLAIPSLASLRKTHAALRVSLTERDPADVGDLLRSGDLDLAIVGEYDNVPSSLGTGVEVEPILDEPVYLASLRIYDAEPSDAIRSNSSAQWIAGNPGTLCQLMSVRSAQSHGFEPDVVHHVDDFAAQLRLVADGCGVAMIPQLGLVNVPSGVVLTELPVHRRTGVAMRTGSGAHPAISACVTALRAAADYVAGAKLRPADTNCHD